MIGLYVCIGRQRSKKIEIAKERVTVGSDASNDLVLRDGGVAPFHGTLVRVRDRWFLASREANALTSNRMRALEDGARLRIGEYTLVLATAVPGAPRASSSSVASIASTAPTAPRPVRLPAGTPAAPMPAAVPLVSALPPPLPPLDPEPESFTAEVPGPDGPAPDPVERSLIDAIVRGDEDSRLVYADWLEARGDALRAEFLRLQRSLAALEPTDPAYRDLLEERMRRLGELAPQIGLAWRRMLGRPVVEGCDRIRTDFQCKMDWGSLAPTDQPNVRRCGACGDNVYYVTTIRAARDHVRLGRCIAVDFGQEREPDDLDDTRLQLLRSPMPGPIPRGPMPRLPTA